MEFLSPGKSSRLDGILLFKSAVGERGKLPKEMSGSLVPFVRATLMEATSGTLLSKSRAA